MASFFYRGRSSSGELVTGVLEGDDASQIAGRLTDLGVTPVDIKPETQSPKTVFHLQTWFGSQRPRLEDILMFSRQMHALVRSGVPLVRGLAGLRDTSRNPVMQKVLTDVVESLSAGQDLAGSLAQHPQIFSSLYISLIRVGENSGTLEKSFAFMHQYLALERRTRNQIKASLRYPSIVVVAIMIAMAILTVFVIPAFARLYHRFGHRLPLPTRIIFGISIFVSHYWWLILFLAAISGWLIYAWLKTPNGRYRWDRSKLRLPVVGSLLIRSALGRFARTFAIVQRAGVPLIQGIGLVADSVGNAYLSERLLEIRNGIEHGASITATANATGLFPGLVLQMIQVGEESGTLDDMLDEVGQFYEDEVDYDLSRLSSLLEPIILGFVAAMVLVLALGVYLPIWNLYLLAQH